MTSTARVLSTNELGRVRYTAAVEKGEWPVEVRYRDSTVSISRPEEVHLNAVLSNQHVANVRFERAARAEWCAILPAPLGPLAYDVVCGDKVVAAGGLDVQAPAKPLALTSAVMKLRTSAPSGAKQLDTKLDTPNLYEVCFLFVEEVFTIQDVLVEIQGIDEPLKLTKKRKGQAEHLGIFEDAFVGITTLAPGNYSFRFRADLREHARPETAPFTNLGWDPAHSDPAGLATWMMSVKVEPVKQERERTTAPSQAPTSEIEVTSSPVSIAEEPKSSSVPKSVPEAPTAKIPEPEDATASASAPKTSQAPEERPATTQEIQEDRAVEPDRIVPVTNPSPKPKGKSKSSDQGSGVGVIVGMVATVCLVLLSFSLGSKLREEGSADVLNRDRTDSFPDPAPSSQRSRTGMYLEHSRGHGL